MESLHKHFSAEVREHVVELVQSRLKAGSGMHAADLCVPEGHVRPHTVLREAGLFDQRLSRALCCVGPVHIC